MAFNTYSEQKRLNTETDKIIKKSMSVVSTIDNVNSIETGMNKSTDNEKSKKQIREALY